MAPRDHNEHRNPESAAGQIDALLLKLPGVSARKINGLDAYFVSDRMFACISGTGVGLRLPAATATELQFSRDNIHPFQPGGVVSTRGGYRSTVPTRRYERISASRPRLEFVKPAGDKAAQPREG
jgi:hypothetical protein